MHKLSVIIPLYNEETYITELLDKVVAATVSIPKEIIIVNDGSTDLSYEVVQSWIKTHSELDVKLLTKSNGGKGSAFRMGVEASTGSIVINQDADLEYDPNDYQVCIDPILKGEAHVVYGSREMGRRHASAHFMFLMGGYAVTAATNFLYGSSITDEPTCYKTFDGPLIRTLLFKGNHFEWEPEITAKLLRLGFEIKDVPINYYPRNISEGKKIKWYDGVEALWTLLKWRFIPIGKLKEKLKTVPVESQNSQLSTFSKVVKTHFNLNLFLILAFLIAIGLRLVFAWPSFEDPLKYLVRPDSNMYLKSAMSLLDHGTYAINGEFTSFYPPGYPAYIASIFALFGKHPILPPLISIFLSCVVMWMTYITAKCFTSRGVSILAALLVGLNPTMIAHAPLYLSDTLFLFVISIQLFCFAIFWKKSSTYAFVLSVVLAGLGAWIRPVTLVWIIPAVFMLLIKKDIQWSYKIKMSIISTVLFIGVMMPWCIRNYEVGHGFNIASSAPSVYRYHMNVALEASLTGQNSDSLRMMYAQEDHAQFALYPDSYKTVAERNAYIMHKCKEISSLNTLTLLNYT